MLDGSVFLEVFEHSGKRVFDPVVAHVQLPDATDLRDQRRNHVRTFKRTEREETWSITRYEK